jgi:hypothetical protein
MIGTLLSSRTRKGVQAERKGRGRRSAKKTFIQDLYIYFVNKSLLDMLEQLFSRPAQSNGNIRHYSLPVTGTISPVTSYESPLLSSS